MNVPTQHTGRATLVGALVRRWRDLKIGHRITLWLLLAALVTLAVAVVAIYALLGQGRRLTDLAETDRTVQADALELKTVVEQESGGVLGYLLSGDQALLDPYTRGHERHTAIVAGLEPLITSVQQENLLAEIQSLHTAFRQLADAQVTLHGQGFPQAAVFLWQSQGNAVKETLVQRLDEFIGLQEAVIADHARRAGEQRTRALLISLSLVGLVWIVSVVGGVLTTRSIVTPIRRLVSAAEAIGHGDTKTPIEASSKDELGLLGSAMAHMARDLDESRQRMEALYREESRRANQLRTLNDVGRKISSILTLEELLPYVVNSLQQTFGMYAVAIFLFDEDSPDLVLEASASRAGGNVARGRRLKPGSQGITLWVGENGKSLLASDVSREPRYLPLAELPDTRAELSVPIKLGDEVQGVLDIQSSEVGGLTEADVTVAETLADQVAIAIENARLYQQTRELAVIEERNRMAREIHDTLAQGFTGIILQLEAAEQSLEDGGGREGATQHLARAKTLARESLQAARRSVWNLLPQALEQRSLEAALEDEVRRFQDIGREKARFTLTGARRELRPDVQSALLRICQESLTNIRRHAKAAEVDVALSFEADCVRLHVRDNGVGFDTGARRGEVKPGGGGFGLYAMEQRVRLVGGSLLVRSKKGEGTSIEVTVPVK